MSFNLAFNLHISPFSFDDVDFLEFVWQYERLISQKSDNKEDVTSIFKGS
jgi:hypothetical protein